MLSGNGMVPPDPCIMLMTLSVASGSPLADVALLVELNGFAGLALSSDFFFFSQGQGCFVGEGK